MRKVCVHSAMHKPCDEAMQSASRLCTTYLTWHCGPLKLTKSNMAMVAYFKVFKPAGIDFLVANRTYSHPYKPPVYFLFYKKDFE